MTNSLAQRLGWVLWPSSGWPASLNLASSRCSIPPTWYLFGVPIEADRMPIRTIGFFGILGHRRRVERADRIPRTVALRGQPLHAGAERAAARLPEAVPR